MNLRFLLALCLSIPVSAQTVADNNSKPASPANPAAPAANAPAATKPTVTANEPLQAAQALMEKGQLKDAAAAFKALVEKDPASAEAHVGLVRSLLRSRQFDEAQSAAKAATVALPNSALVHATVGDVAFRMGDFGSAEAEYRAALKLDSNAPRGLLGMARMYEMVSMNKRAKDTLAKAHQSASEDGRITDEWVETLPYSERLEQVKKMAGDHPSHNEAEEITYLTAVARKKPWVLASEYKPAEIKIVPYGKEITGVYDINRNGPATISKGYGLALKFNDRATATLLLDTGASGVTIGRKLAEKAGAVKIANTKIGGIGDKGAVDSYVAWIDKINIGSVEFHDCIVVVSSKSDVADEAGLVGPDIFEKFLITLDFRDQKMQLAPLPPNPNAASQDDEWQDRYIVPEMQSFTKFYRFGHDIVVPVVVNDKALGNFIIDTGADLNSLSPKFAAQVTKASADDDYEMKGVSGKVDSVLTGKKAVLQFAKMRIESHDLPVFAIDNISSSEGTEIAGFIGIRSLVQMKMTLDYRDGLINLQVYEFRKARE